MSGPAVQVVQELTLEAVEKLEAEEDAWLLAFFRGAPASDPPLLACSALRVLRA